MSSVYDHCYHCESCGAAIVWIKTAEGLTPCNATPVYYIEKPRSGSKKIVTPNGEVLSCEYTEDPYRATGTGFIPHRPTCTAVSRAASGKQESEELKNGIN